jgi:hypothetical protein
LGGHFLFFSFNLRDEEYEYRSFQQCGANTHEAKVKKLHYRSGKALRVPGV